jgi:alpha-aminoadipic semialdehyde synthase
MLILFAAALIWLQKKNACITNSNGQLMPAYRYLDALIKRAPTFVPRATRDRSMTFSLEGHLFDSGLINQILNVIEQCRGTLEFEQCLVPPLVNAKSAKSSALVRITVGEETSLSHILRRIQTLVDVIPNSEAVLRRVDLSRTRHSFDLKSGAGFAAVVDRQKQHKVLVLGAGHVAEALVDFLGRSNSIRVTVASESDEDARRVALAAGNGQHVALNVCDDKSLLSSLVECSDVVMSLLPAPLHPIVTRECIHHRTHMVTASYESQEMRSLGSSAQEAGIILLNEVGLDPGLDHMSAKRVVDDIHHRGGVVTLFSSVCGGLPAPDVAHGNPFRYKFSWSPRGVIRACQNSARYRWEGHVQEVHESNLLRSASPFVEAWQDLELECIPNRDSLSYESVYNVPGVRSIFRGTLRYRGFSSMMNVFRSMGLFGSDRAEGKTWEEVLHSLRMHRGGFSSLRDFVEACADDDHELAQRVMEAIEWLGLKSPAASDSVVADAFCSLLESKLHYDHGERDMVVMHHRIEAEFEDETHEKHVSSLQVFGDTKASAMSKTVGYTAAAAVELITDGLLQNCSGSILPTSDRIYLPVLAKVAREGILFDEKVYIRSSTPSVERSA